MPSYPVYVLSVLQAFDSATPIDITASTHGYFYELFIRTTLARGRNSRDFDIVASYLAFVAYRMQETGVRAINSADFRTVHEAYEEHYDISRSFAELIRQLVDQGILIEIDDTFRFKYGYLFNYFVASYMKDHIARPDVRDMLTNVAGSAHTESSANILLFLAHLSKDPVIISELLNASRHLYASYDPAELGEDIGFLANLWSGLPKAAYEDRDPRESREAMLATMDRDKLPDMGLDEETVEQESPDVDAEDPIVRFITALRHLEILGQVLKNFPGSLEASVKLDIARECFHLGLRSLSVVFEMVKTDQSDILDVMSEEIKQRHPGLATWEVDSRARDSLVGVVHMLSYGLVKRVGKAVGSRDLFGTYDRLIDESKTPAFSLINSALKMDNSNAFPSSLIKEVASKFEDAPLPLSVLRHLVVAHFHLFPVDFRTKQSISSSVGIKYSALQRVSPRAKMLPAPE